MAKYKLVGMKRKEIETLLGKPTDVVLGPTYCYALGPGKSKIPNPIDYEFLTIKFKYDVAEQALVDPPQ